MKFIDRYVGLLVCTGLFLFDKFMGIFFSKTREFTKVNTILFIKFWGLGTITVASPSLHKIQEKYPDAKVIFLTLARNKEICGLLNLGNEILTVEVKGGILKFIVDVLKVLLQLRKNKIDLAIDLEFFTRFSAIVSYLSGAKKRVGFQSWEIWRGGLHTDGVPFNRYWHMARNFQSLVEAVGCKFSDLLLPLIHLEEIPKKIDNLVAKMDNRFICVNSNSAVEFNWPRRWPQEYFIKLIDELIKRYQIKIVLIGSREETLYVKNIISKLKHPEYVLNLSGEINIAELIYLLKLSKLLITNDSGPMHLASAVGTPTVSFFGPSTPVISGPLGERHIVYFKNFSCSPCINLVTHKEPKCHYNRPQCLENITVEEVLSGIEEKKLI